MAMMVVTFSIYTRGKREIHPLGQFFFFNKKRNKTTISAFSIPNKCFLLKYKPTNK